MEIKNSKMRSFEADTEQYDIFKVLCIKKGVTVGSKINEFITKFNKEYGI